MTGNISEAALQEMLDRQAIVEVLNRYAIALDARNWSLFKTCFTDDAVVDYGKRLEGPSAVEKLVRYFEEPLKASQHLISNFAIEIKGDEARSSCYLQAVHYLPGTEGGDTWIVGGTYRDQLIRTAEGWKIKSRTLDATWVQGNPIIGNPRALEKARTQGKK